MPRKAEYQSPTDTDRRLPANSDAERAVLGAVLLVPEVFHEVKGSGVHDVYFAEDKHRRIYRAMVELAASNTPIDLITVAEQLSKKREVEALGGVAYLSSLTDGVPHRVSVASYVQIMRDCYQRRAVIYAANKSIDQMFDLSENVSFCLGGLSDELLAVKADVITAPSRQVGELAVEALAEIDAQMFTTREVIGIPFGIEELDLTTTGIREGEFIICGGFPGSGKTSLATSIGFNAARTGIPVEMFSIEMKQVAVAKRVLSLYTEVSSTVIRNPRHLHTADFRTLEAAIPYLKEVPMWIDDRCGQDVMEVVARAHLAIRKKKVGLVIVDFLQLLNGPGENRNEQVGNAAKALTQMAKDTGVPVLCLSQLSRPEGKDPNARPNMFYLRDSGAIEQYSHLIVFTYRPVDDRREPTGEDEIIIGKQREGTTGSVPAWFDKNSLAWRDRKRAPGPPKEQQQSLGLGESKKTKSKKGSGKNVGVNENPRTENAHEGETGGSASEETAS